MFFNISWFFEQNKTRVTVNVSKENATYEETEELGKRVELKSSILAFLYNFCNKNR